MAIIVIKRDRSIMQYEISELDSWNVLKINPLVRAYLTVSWQRFRGKIGFYDSNSVLEVRILCKQDMCLCQFIKL